MLSQKYRRVHELDDRPVSKGSYGKVFVAVKSDDQTVVVVKRVPEGEASLRELAYCKAACNVHSEHVMKILDWFQAPEESKSCGAKPATKSFMYFVYEWMDSTLWDLFSARAGKFAMPEALQLCSQALDGARGLTRFPHGALGAADWSIDARP